MAIASTVSKVAHVPSPAVAEAERLDRRFEGVVLVGAAVLAAVPPDAVGALRREGVGVAVVADAPPAELVGRWGDAGAGPGVLLAAAGRGVDVAVVEAGRRPVPSRRADADAAGLDRAAEALARRLAILGVPSAVLERQPASPVAVVELAGDERAAGDGGPAALTETLLAAGLSGSGALVDLAASAAHDAGVDGARVTLDGARVRFTPGHEGDAVRWACGELWRRGVGRHDVLVLAGGLGATRDDLDPLLDPDLEGITVVSVDVPEEVVPPDVIAWGGGPDGIRQLLEDQVRRRREREVPAPAVEPGWAVARTGFDPVRERVEEACFALADGRIGTAGAPLAGHPGTHRQVLVGGVYQGEGPETRLLTAPAVFHLPRTLDDDDRLRRVLDLRTGVLHEEVAGLGGTLRSARFSSGARPGTVALRAASTGPLGPTPPLLPPADDEVFDTGVTGDVAWARAKAGGGGVAVAAVQEQEPVGGGEVIDRIAVYDADAAGLPDAGPAQEAARRAAATGFDRLLAEHRQAWATRWEDADIAVEGDDDLQLAVRFALFHLMASVPDTGEAAVGARGLSGTGYRGHVFWDADTFVLPFLAATHPAAARAMLEYRIQRLPAALAAAREAGRAGARFPWESARTGRDVTPPSARNRTGRLVPIRTGQLEDHIVAEVAWAADFYVRWSGDDEFARGPGMRLLVETARYWASRIRVEPDGSAHVYGVIGPDEYHEPVDDNAFTNVMARWNLRRAAAAAEATSCWDAGVDEADIARWRHLADALVDGWDPDTGLYEQFAGFGKLEPLVIAEVAPRRPIAADLLLGAERVHGAQVLKQADVLMLHHLVPDEVMPGTLEANLRFYEPRTAHGSSLSPSIHASLLARVRDFDRALAALRIASHIDLEDLTGSTAGGLHVATMGGLWQALAFGFCGLRPAGGRLHVDPLLPPAWSALDVRVRFHGARIRVRIERARLTITADSPAAVSVGGTDHTVGPGTLVFRRRGPNWEVTP